MISTESLTKDWIFSYKRTIKGSDPSIIERMIRAFYLVENITLSGCKFLFKGGTSLALVCKKLRRFSVDVDILTKEDRVSLENYLDYVVANSDFLRWELDEKRSFKVGIKKAHYMFFYKSIISNLESMVLLDVLIDDCEFTDSIESPIDTGLLIIEEPLISTKTPSLNLFLGDKLTAFAPNTIGIPYNAKKEREIVKQIFDLNFILEGDFDLHKVLNNYNYFAKKQIEYRGLNLNTTDTLHDIIDTAVMIAFGRIGIFRHESDKEKFQEIIRGISQFKQFSAGIPYHIDQVLLSSSRIAYLASIFLSDFSKPFLLYREEEKIDKFLITKQDCNKINKIKNIPGGALYYLYQILQ